MVPPSFGHIEHVTGFKSDFEALRLTKFGVARIVRLVNIDWTVPTKTAPLSRAMLVGGRMQIGRLGRIKQDYPALSEENRLSVESLFRILRGCVTRSNISRRRPRSSAWR